MLRRQKHVRSQSTTPPSRAPYLYLLTRNVSAGCNFFLEDGIQPKIWTPRSEPSLGFGGAQAPPQKKSPQTPLQNVEGSDDQQVLNPYPSKPHPCNMPQAKTEVALQFLECCAAEVALQHWLFCSAEVIFTKSCAATSEKLHCNIENAALQKSGAFLPLSCGFQAPTFGHPRLGPAEMRSFGEI